MIRAFLFLLLAVPARAAGEPDSDQPPPGYQLRLTFERGGEERVFETSLTPAQTYNGAVASSGTLSETLIVSAMLVPADDAERVEVVYQAEWDVDQEILQAQGSAVLFPREDSVLVERPGRWKIRARVTPHRDHETCTPPPSGGGLAASVRIRGAGRDRIYERRAPPYLMHNMTSRSAGEDLVSLGLELQPTGPGEPVPLRYITEVGGVSTGERRKTVPLGVETLAEGDGKDDGVWLRVDEVPTVRPAKVSFTEVPDGRGWVRHTDQLFSFLHPARWQVDVTCDSYFKFKALGITDTSLSAEKRPEFVMFANLLRPAPGATLERATRERAAVPGRAGPIETIELPKGRCALWRVDGEALLLQALCDVEGAPTLGLSVSHPPSIADPYAEFKRLLSSLAPGTPRFPQ